MDHHLQSMDLNDINTISIHELGCMFYNCIALTSLNVNNNKNRKLKKISTLLTEKINTI